jgi:hypothetical protein
MDILATHGKEPDWDFKMKVTETFAISYGRQRGQTTCRVDMKWRFQFFAKYDHQFQLDVIIVTIITFLL